MLSLPGISFGFKIIKYGREQGWIFSPGISAGISAGIINTSKSYVRKGSIKIARQYQQRWLYINQLIQIQPPSLHSQYFNHLLHPTIIKKIK